MPVRIVCAVLGTILILTGTSDAQLNPEYAELAAQFKAKGQSGFTLLSPPQGGRVSLTERLTHSALAVVTLLKAEVAQSLRLTNIYTWDVFRVERIVSAVPPARPFYCSGESPELPPLSKDEIAGRSFGGTTQINGVSVTFTDGTPRPTMGVRYLAFLSYCSASTAEVTPGASQWITVDDRGGIVSGSQTPLASEVVGFGTVDRLQSALTKSRGRP